MNVKKEDIKRYVPPFTIHVVWHPSFKEGQNIADMLYGFFSRNADTPLTRGIGIPVYYRSASEKGKTIPKKITFTGAEFNAIVLLVDDFLFNDDDWVSYVKSLVQKTSDKTRIFPISFSDNAYYVDETFLGKEQFIDGRPQNDLHRVDQAKEIKSRLLHGFCRLLLEKKPLHEAEKEVKVPPPIQLFISHAKKDGEKEAEAFRDFVRTNTKLSTFFDANDIADGYRFDSQIKEAIKEGYAALVVFHSDAYSEREWCQIEILTGKRYKTPIVVVHNIQKGETRSFPYLGNVPTIKLDIEHFDEIVDLTLYQVLHNIYQSKHLSRIGALYLPMDIESIAIASPPELFNFIDIIKEKNKSKKKTFIVLYPDPPIGLNEMNVLNDFDKKVDFLTPLQLSKFIK